MRCLPIALLLATVFFPSVALAQAETYEPEGLAPSSQGAAQPMPGHAKEPAADDTGAKPLGLHIRAGLGQSMLIYPKPSLAADTSSFGIGAGYSLTQTLRTELDFVFGMKARKQAAFDFEIRPSVLVAPKGWPNHFRLTTGVVGLVEAPRSFLVAGHVGSELRFDRKEPVTIFVELGFLSHADYTPKGRYRLHWVAEARIGGFFSL